MPSAKEVTVVVIAVTIAATLFTPVSDITAANTGTQTVTNESVTADHGTFVELDGYAINSGSETVYNASGAEMTRGVDYEMDYGGAIKTLQGGNITDGNTITVSYTWQATSGTTTTVVQLIPLFLALLILGVLAAKIKVGM